MARSGCQRGMSRTSTVARSGVGWWRVRSVRLAAGVGQGTLKKGKAHARLLQGTRTRTPTQSQRMPLQVAVWPVVERTAA